MYSQCLAFVYCEIILVLGVFQESVLRILSYSQYFRVRYSGYCCTLKYFGVRYSGILSVLEVFRVFRDSVLHVLEYLQYFGI